MPGMKLALGSEIQVIEKGALDGLSLEEIRKLYPKAHMTPLVTRLSDGSQVVIGEEEIIPRVQAKIAELNAQGVELIVLLCTGHFPQFSSQCLLLEAQKVVDHCVEACVRKGDSIGLLVPLPEQMNQSRENLSHVTPHVIVASASPYASEDELLKAAEIMKQNDVKLVVMHCMGYRNDHRKKVREITGKPVILSNAIVARTAAELIAV
jgi:protein AroM